MAGVEPAGAGEGEGREFRPSMARALWAVAALCAWTVWKNLFKVQLKHPDEPLMSFAAGGMPLLFFALAWLWLRWALPSRIVAGADGLEIHGWNSRDRIPWSAVQEVRLVDRFWSPTRWILEEQAGKTRTFYRLGLGDEEFTALGEVLHARGVPPE